MSQLIAGMRCFTAEWSYNGGNVTIDVPAGWRVKDVVSEIETALNGTGVMTVGFTGNTDAFLADADQGGGAAGAYPAAVGSADKKYGYTLGVGEKVEIDITPGDATQGAGTVFVYAHPTV